MHRLSARTTWYAYEAATSFLGMLAFTVTAVYYVTEVGMSPLQLVLVGTLMEVAIFVFEVPTGIVADVHSRRLSIVAGTFVMGIAVGLARNVGRPVFQTWLNRNVEESGVRATVLSITNQADAVGQWTGGPAIGLIGNVFSIRAALSAGALCMAPALALYRRAARHHGEAPALESLPPISEP